MKNIFGVILSLSLCVASSSFAESSNSVADKIPETTVGSAITPSETTKTEENTNQVNIEELKAKAETGDIDALLNLGYIYLYGTNGVNTNYKQALAYYEAAAGKGSAVAYNNLGSLYFSGIGTNVDYPKAIHFFEEAAKLGSHDAAVNLAIIYLGNDSDKKDYEKIIGLLNSAEPDNNIAKYLLGYCYFKGFHVEQDNAKAFQLIKTAADGNYDEAQYMLADFYVHGIGAPKNYTKAVDYLQKATEQGNAAAATELADILSLGKAYPKDIKKAHMLYNIASVWGNKDAGEKRDALESHLAIEDLLAVQAEAENYKPQPSKETTFVRQTYGNSLKVYIDSNIKTDDTQK